VYDNSYEADPHAGLTPKPQLIVHVRKGKVVASCALAAIPAWAKPIMLAVLKIRKAQSASRQAAEKVAVGAIPGRQGTKGCGPCKLKGNTVIVWSLRNGHGTEGRNTWILRRAPGAEWQLCKLLRARGSE
jgi:hypothetical protein